MVKKHKRRFTRCAMTGNIWQALHQWYRTPLGAQVEADENRQMNEVLSNLFGFYLLFIGHPAQSEWLRSSRVSRCMLMDICHEKTELGSPRFHGQPQALPVASDSLDVIVLPHVLELSDTPHEVLREVERTLVPEGHVVVLGFNPFSWWGVWRWLLGWRGQLPWCGHFISTTRAKDWRALLGFEIMETRYYFYRPPVQQEGLLARLQFLERIGKRYFSLLGGGYVLVARKRVATLTPIRPRWRSRRKMASPELVKPMSNQHKTSTE